MDRDRGPFDPIAAVQQWTGKAELPSTHVGLVDALRAWTSGNADTEALRSILEARRERVGLAILGLRSSSEACDLLAPDMLQAIAGGLAAMERYVEGLDAVDSMLQGGALNEACYEALDGLQATVVQAHEHLAATTPPDRVHLALSEHGATVPNLWRLHQVLQAFLNHRASLSRARAAVLEQAERFEDARVRWTPPPADAPDVLVPAETLYRAYEEGIGALADLEGALTACDADALGPPWQRLEDAFEQMRDAQRMRFDVEDDLGFDVWSDEA